MQNLKDHFNRQARRERKQREAQRDLDFVFFILWMMLFREWERRNERERMTRPKPPG